jgi:hypothetical protein
MKNYIVQQRVINTATLKKIYSATLKNMHCNIRKISTATTCNIAKTYEKTM